MLNTTPSTISRALRDEAGISKKTKMRVKKLARELDYQPNAVASGLRIGKSNTLGVIVPRVNRDFFSEVISGIEEVAYDNRYNVIICQSHDRITREKQYVETLLRARVDGILISMSLETNEYDHFRKIRKAGVPLIFFDRIWEEMEFNRIVIDDFEGAFKVVQHLIDMGYRRIVHFAGSEYLNIYRNRRDGYMEALRKNNLRIERHLIIYNNLTFEAGRQSMEQLIKNGIAPDALFSASDYAALGALFYMLEQGYRIPEQFGIAGFSNEKFTSYIKPSLTTVDQHSKEIGRYCARLFLEEAAEETSTPRKIVLSPQLIIRESTQRY